MAVVSRLRVAPVKGLATVTVDSISVDEQGVADDRRLLLLDAGGSVVTLRSHPQLVRIVPDLDLDRGVLRVLLPGGEVASSSLDDLGDGVVAHLYGKDRPGRLVRGDVGAVLSEVAGEQVQVMLAQRTGVGWDEGPVSILGRASAAAVGAPDGDTARYRMLVELDGTAPYEEDTWVGRDLQIGAATVRVTHQLVRCLIINQSPATGTKDWEGLHTLAALRGPDLCLGVIAEVVAPGKVAVGATVTVQQG